MSSDTRTPDDIERDIAVQRAQMTGTIGDLQKKFSVDAIVNDIGTMFRNDGGDLGRSISQTIGRNPAAVALVGVGLAWLFIGEGRKDTTPDRRSGAGARNRGYSRASSWDGAHAGSNGGDRSWYGAGSMSRADRFPDHPTQGNPGEDGSNGITDRIQDAAGAASNAVSDAAGTLGDSARRLTDRLSHGTEALSDEARDRVVAARRAAHEARLSAEDAMNRAGRTAVTFFEDQPLVVGALAAAVGAAVAGALPHSRVEDDAMGDSSDRLFAEAEAVFREERKKAMAVLRSAATDVKEEVTETGSDLKGLLPDGQTVGEVIADRTTQAAARVADGARDEAKARNLGRRER
ncbi:DUF3618 domain-containing protein [Rhodobaculum claviforme]|uniref:DUF3618 domain-containing protein n=1 Tax=Rhodobaculum claviforme TaxID=1549854 RepID=A0A934TIH6_9RHOB|nr:DUF3618 domain-containing protein [Rhodobaculum claviforme]MBK5926437.1 hypothetical protein [Rhodobaculum claviforme]